MGLPQPLELGFPMPAKQRVLLVFGVRGFWEAGRGAQAGRPFEVEPNFQE